MGIVIWTDWIKTDFKDFMKKEEKKIVNKRYITIQTISEAIQFKKGKKDSEGNLNCVIDFLKSGEKKCNFKKTEDGLIKIETLEGEMLIIDKDWVIKGVDGEFYPCKPSVFYKKYKEHKNNE